MARKERKYKRLPGRPFSLFNVRSLWQGPDHLLWVETVFFKENYKRFFFKDIQSVVLQRTNTHTIWTFVWGAPALVCGLIALLMPGPSYVSGSFAIFFLLALALNLAMGPSCSVYLQTAVQIQTLASLKRVRTAKKTMARIKTMVEAVQGSWENRTGLNAQSAAAGGFIASPDGTRAGSNQGRDLIAKGPFKPLLHQVLFGMLLALGAVAAVQLQLKNLLVALMETLLHSTIQLLVIVALVRWYRHIKGSPIARINWVALVFVAVQTLIGYGLYIAASLSNPMINYHHWAMFKQMFEIQFMDHPLALAGNLIYAGGSIMLGFLGLIVLRLHWRGTQSQEGER